MAARKRGELVRGLRPCFARPEPWLQAGKYVGALAGDLPRSNGWTIAQQAGDRSPQRTQRLLNRACWDAFAAMGVVRRFAVAGLDEAARRCGRRRGLRIGAVDETSQVKQGCVTAGVKRQYLGCVGKVANGITTVHLSYVRERTGHALIGARQWIPAEQVGDPVQSLLMGLPDDLQFRTKGELAIDICAESLADGVMLDYVCGDEVYGSCTKLREFFEAHGQGYVLRVPSSFRLTLAAEVTLTCAGTVTRLLKGARRWEIRSAGHGSKGQRWYAWALLATASPRHHLLIRRHLASGELAFHYCHTPQGQPVSMARLIRAAGLRWPVEMRHLWCRSTRVVLSLLCSLPVGGLGPAGAAVVSRRAGASLAELLHLRGVCGDDPVLAARGVPGGGPSAVDPVVEAGGGHAQGGGQAGDRPFAGCQAG
jgi:DDE superfamily endonuclease